MNVFEVVVFSYELFIILYLSYYTRVIHIVADFCKVYFINISVMHVKCRL